MGFSVYGRWECKLNFTMVNRFLIFTQKPITVDIKTEDLKFQYIPDYASYLLKNKLEEFVTVGIRFCREMDLPMMRPLQRMSEKELVEISITSNKELLTALAANNVAPLFEERLKQFIKNQMVDKQGQKILDRSEIIADDIILGTYVKRKLFAFFLHSYTQNAVVHTLIMAELDFYTTKEQLITSKAIIEHRRTEEAKH